RQIPASSCTDRWIELTRGFDNFPALHVISNFCPPCSSNHGCRRISGSSSGGPMKYRMLRPLALVLLLTALAAAQDVASFEKRITVKKLPNGLTLMICERPEAPVFSFFTLVDAGSAQDPMRQ